MSWDAVITAERSSSCCWCGITFDEIHDVGFQMTGSPSGVPMNLWCCARCAPVARAAGYGVLGRTPNRRPRRPVWRHRQAAVLVALIIAAVILGALVAVVYPTTVHP
ncbi:hypothetical protein [Agreia sp. COWG]|uniref:hypothetical protein n=1 Tax=Agreia sp. COWG TaxID=2773266 RepID=UPI00192896E5|nr:hypothetical protein [Agreia sp. COWG]CAD5999439.1 conserved protein of unknown function [Agreia sp. COWG]